MNALRLAAIVGIITIIWGFLGIFVPKPYSYLANLIFSLIVLNGFLVLSKKYDNDSLKLSTGILMTLLVLEVLFLLININETAYGLLFIAYSISILALAFSVLKLKGRLPRSLGFLLFIAGISIFVNTVASMLLNYFNEVLVLSIIFLISAVFWFITGLTANILEIIFFFKESEKEKSKSKKNQKKIKKTSKKKKSKKKK